jgi:hypothetical protein
MVADMPVMVRGAERFLNRARRILAPLQSEESITQQAQVVLRL